jgi:hypothetical protein
LFPCSIEKKKEPGASQPPSPSQVLIHHFIPLHQNALHWHWEDEDEDEV